jgi:hypothetical protein
MNRSKLAKVKLSNTIRCITGCFLPEMPRTPVSRRDISPMGGKTWLFLLVTCVDASLIPSGLDIFGAPRTVRVRRLV